MSVNKWFARTRPQTQPAARLFCFPFAGGGTSSFRPWASLYPAEIEICPVQMPGRESRMTEPPARNLARLAADIAQGLGPALDRPFAFFGHSLGAIVAFEVTRQLRRMGASLPDHLFLSGHGPAFVETRANPFHLMPDGEFLDAVRKFGGLPDAVLRHRELLEMILPVLKADFELYETHRHVPEAPLNIPISALGGLSDFSVPRRHLEAWSGETTYPLDVRMFPGGHFYLQQCEPLPGLVASVLPQFPDPGIRTVVSVRTGFAAAHSPGL